jgi:cyclopropane fatty-acyl-phospholipid synthase-like methyltransferase
MNGLADFILSHWTLVVQTVIAASLLMILWVYLSVLWGGPWIPANMRAARRMLQLAGVKPGDTVVDLGAGDGRIVILAARDFQARAAGVEIDPLRCLMANLWIRMLGLRDGARVQWGNVRSFSVAEADVVTVFLLPRALQSLKDRLMQSLQPGTRVVAHTFPMNGWTPTVLDERYGIFVYEMGKTGEETITEISV